MRLTVNMTEHLYNNIVNLDWLILADATIKA